LGTLKIWHLSCVVGALTASPVAGIYQIAALRTNAVTPNTIVAAAFSAMPLNTTTVLAKVSAAPSAPIVAAKFSSLSPNALVATEFGASAPDAVASSDVTGALPQARLVSLTYDSPEVAPAEQDASFLRDHTPLHAAAADPAARELPYLRDYVYSETPPPQKPAKIALAALSDVPLGTPDEEIKRASIAFGLDYNFMKAVAKIESGLDPKERTGSYIGLFQLSHAEFNQYGSGEITDSRDNAIAAAYKFVTEATLFESLTHQKPTFADLYLIHQQGWEGAAEHVNHPEQLAWKSMCATDEGMAKGERWCKRAIWGNTLPAVKREWKSVDRLTSGAFVAMWRNRVDSLYARYAEAGSEQAKQ
jgi:hypothetical protein